MLRAATTFAIIALFAAAPALADDAQAAEPSTQAPTLDQVRASLKDVRIRLAEEWQRARAAREVLEELQESHAATTDQGAARIAELRSTLDDCRARIESLRGARSGLVEQRVALRGQAGDSPSVFADAVRSGQR